MSSLREETRMATLTTYFIKPEEEQVGLTLHLGRQGIGYEETVETCASDTLFAALVAQAATHEGLDPRDGAAPAFARSFWDAVAARREPPLRHSSLFPRIGNLVLLPRPALDIPLGEEHRREIGKGFKKVRYLSPALFAAVCQGDAIPEMPLIVQQGKVWLTQQEAVRLPAPWAKRAKETVAQWQARLTATPIWKIDPVPHVTIDRLHNASNFYEVGRVWFTPGCGLALLVAYHDPNIRRMFELLLELVGESGIGGKRSSGYGACRFECQSDVTLLETLTARTTAPRSVLLSRYLPHRDEMDALVSVGAAYTLVNVGGWLLSPGAMSQQRQQITLVQEGSILVAQQQPVIGAIADVRPDYRAGKSTYPHPKYGRDVGTPHPVYRSGLALTVPVTAPMK
jgi:CRISPR-associated protein Csm4